LLLAHFLIHGEEFGNLFLRQSHLLYDVLLQVGFELLRRELPFLLLGTDGQQTKACY
jgi:hypothetical protein